MLDLTGQLHTLTHSSFESTPNTCSRSSHQIPAWEHMGCYGNLWLLQESRFSSEIQILRGFPWSCRCPTPMHILSTLSGLSELFSFFLPFFLPLSLPLSLPPFCPSFFLFRYRKLGGKSGGCYGRSQGEEIGSLFGQNKLYTCIKFSSN